MTEKYLVDSNILIYAMDYSEAEKHEKAVAFMEKAAFDQQACLSTQNLVEFYSNITNPKKGRALGTEISKQKLSELAAAFRILPYGTRTIVEAAEINAAHRAHFWDALLAATMLENGVKTIYTENVSDFKKIPGIKALNPLRGVYE